MSAPADDLNRLERWMQTVITHPEGTARGIESAEAREQIDISLNALDRVVVSTSALDGLSRLRIYGEAYFARLLECLRSEYPAVLHAIGDKALSAFVFGYLQRYPSRSYTLADLGARFPDYLHETRPADDAPADVGGWSRFLVELARLERVYSEVFDGHGPEGAPLLSHAEITAIAAEDWPKSRLSPVASLRLLELEFPVHEYVTAVRRGENAKLPTASPTRLAVFRRDYIVRRVVLSPPQFAILAAFQEGATVEEAISRAVDANAGDVPSLIEPLGAWFRDWTAAGLLSEVRRDPIH